MPRVYKYADAKRRLEQNSIPVPECGCILWLGRVNDMGYGRMSVNGKSEYVHRTSFALSRGEIPPESNVLHRCDVPTCINPEHLFIGSHADNVADKVAKGRQLRGSDISGSKLTEADVLAIRASALGVNETARQMGVSPMTVSLLRRRKTWAHVN